MSQSGEAVRRWLAQKPPEALTFEASLPPHKSAILLDGMGDGGQMKLDVTRQHASALLATQTLYGGKSFIVVLLPTEE